MITTKIANINDFVLLYAMNDINNEVSERTKEKLCHIIELEFYLKIAYVQ